MATFVLVHGAFHGGWCWREVSARLHAEGHEVHAPTLTGLGERHHLAGAAVDLTTHVQDVANLLQWHELREVTLVGHSYGGMVITGVADRMAERLSSLVYLDALVPENRQSVLDLQPPERRTAILDEVAAGGGRFWPPRSAEFYGLQDPAQQAWVDAKCTPQPFLTLCEPLRLDGPPGGKVGRKLYVLCTEPPLPYMHRFHDMAGATDGWQATTLATGHDAMVTEPERLARLLLEWQSGVRTCP